MLKAPMCFLRVRLLDHSLVIQGTQTETNHGHGTAGLWQTKMLAIRSQLF